MMRFVSQRILSRYFGIQKNLTTTLSPVEQNSRIVYLVSALFNLK